MSSASKPPPSALITSARERCCRHTLRGQPPWSAAFPHRTVPMRDRGQFVDRQSPDRQSPDTHLNVPIIEGKRGKIPDDLPPILARLKIDPDHYVRFINRTQKSRFHGFIGSVKSMRGLAGDFGRSFLKGQAAAAALFSPG